VYSENTKVFDNYKSVLAIYKSFGNALKCIGNTQTHKFFGKHKSVRLLGLIYLSHSGTFFQLVLVYGVPPHRKSAYLLLVSQNKSKCGNMKTFSAWWFSWYAAGRTENATTNHRRERRRRWPFGTRATGQRAAEGEGRRWG
jgi:hypothetical protein